MKRTPLRQMSAKRRRANVERRRNLIAAYGSEPRCAAMFSPDCRGAASEAHEPRMRSRGADVTDPAQCIPVCRPCHDRIHREVALATRAGLLAPSWADSEGEAFEGGDAA